MRRPSTAPWRSSHLEPTEVFEQALDDIRESRRRRRKRRLISTAAGITVLVVATATFIFTQRHIATSVALDEVTASFRATTHPGAAAGSGVSRSSPLEKVTVAAASKRAAPDDDSKPNGPFFLPSEGVYTYRSEGGENISVFGASHEYPDHFYATVRHRGGCRWEHRNDVIEEHVDVRVLCSQEGRLSQASQAREVEFFGRRDGGELFFQPPQLQHAVSDVPGTKSSALAKDDYGNAATVHRTYLGRVEMDIGGLQVDAIRFRLDSTFTGKADGTATDYFWVHPETGMTLRWDRTTDTIADAAFGASVHYQEKASFILESLTPRT